MNPHDTPTQASPDLPTHREGVEAAYINAPVAASPEAVASVQAELPPVTPSLDSSALGVQAQQVAAPTIPPPVTPSQDAATAHSSHSPAIADDNDLIEQEWVDKAKKIVEQTHDDPHRQNDEVNRLKADYIQKRYKKEIKVAEG